MRFFVSNFEWIMIVSELLTCTMLQAAERARYPTTAKHFGVKVTGVCSTSNLDLVKSLGADEVIDYTKENPTKSSEHYDLIFYAVGKRKSSKFKSLCKKALTPIGKYISIDYGIPKIGIECLLLLKELIEIGKIKPVICRSYPLEQIVEAHKYVDSGHKKENLTITIN